MNRSYHPCFQEVIRSRQQGQQPLTSELWKNRLPGRKPRPIKVLIKGVFPPGHWKTDLDRATSKESGLDGPAAPMNPQSCPFVTSGQVARALNEQQAAHKIILETAPSMADQLTPSAVRITFHLGN